GWVIAGGPDVARTVLTSIAAAVITVVGVVFSIVIVALTLTSTQFGPRMLRNFIRDRGTQLTLGTFVATFVYAVLALSSVGASSPGAFVPHISVTVTLALVLADSGILIYFLNHIARQIQLPEVIASIAGDLQHAIELQAGSTAAARADAAQASAIIAGLGQDGGVVIAPRSGYLQYIEHQTLVTIAADADAVIHVLFRPGHFIVAGQQYATVWPAEAATVVVRELAAAHVTGPYRTLAQDVSFGVDQLVEICIRALSTAVNDTFTALTCIDWIADSLCQIAGRWQPTRVHRDSAGTVRVIATEVTWERLVQRAFEKIRQGSAGMPAVMIRQLGALARVVERTPAGRERQVLLDQADMIERLSATTVPEAADRADISRIYAQVVVAARTT
ncbi:MAG: DUF2254 domain-containing protein, partial [Actinobacteria bacterium]|nr:DUF2254 domain-containing protein [Actinomycetota bacterium]